MSVRKAKAAVLVETGRFEIREFPIPEVGREGVLVKMEIAGVCGTDIHKYHGHVKVPLPVIPGHENLGRIERLGEGVKHDAIGNTLKVGDRVTWTPGISCGRCYFCLIEGEPTKCLNRWVYGYRNISDGLTGGFAEYVYLIPGTSIFKIPEDIPSERYIAMDCGIRTMLHAVERVEINPGDSVIIQGSGPVGLAGVLIAKHRGASTVIVIGAPELRLKFAKEVGADYVINIENTKEIDKRVEMVKGLLPYGADVVFEASGNPVAVPEGIELVRGGGRYCIVGQFGDRGPVPINPQHINSKNMTIKGSWGTTPRDNYLALKLQRNIRYPLEKMITSKFLLDEIVDAIKSVEKVETMKSVIVFARA